MRKVRRLVVVAVLGTLVAGLTTPARADTPVNDETAPDLAASAVSVEASSVDTLQAPTFDAVGSVEQAWVIGAHPGAFVELRDATDAVVASGTTDALGGLLFRQLLPGEGYTFAVAHEGETTVSAPFTILDSTHPPFEFYESLPPLPVDGYGYMPTRDGTTLSVRTVLPGPPEEGPYPTLVEYSGYAPSNPAASLDDNPFAFIAGTLGYAYVGVNIRGSGCSGGAFDFFEELQSLDGYDMIESVAAQPWSDQIGMVGVSYPGISQLYVAATRPPHLDAVAPLSVLDDIFRGTLYPGGIFNSGFAKDWATDRVESNRWPGGAGWVTSRVNAGDQDCAYNVLLRQQNRDLLAQIEANPYYPAPGNPDYPDGADPFTPYHFVDQIEVPTFLAGAWQDEQTGGHFPYLLERLDGVPEDRLKVHLYNGTHADPLAPDLALRLVEFYEFYLAERIPSIPPGVRLLAPLLYSQLLGIDGLTIPPDRFTGFGDYEAALAAYEAEPTIRVLWESGAADPPGAPIHRGESFFDAWPVPSTSTTFFLGPDGTLTDEAPHLGEDEPRTVSRYVSEPDARPASNYSGGTSGIWRANPPYNWTQHVDSSSLLFETDPLDTPLTIVGPSSLDLWLRSDAADTDLQVTLTEVYHDGEERYVQSGWLRASQRALDESRSTELAPVPTHLEVDAAPLPAGEFTEVRVALFPVAHAFRAGSRLRIAISAPGGDRPLWQFDSLSDGETNEIAHSEAMPSALVLPTVANPELPDPRPPCPSLRGQFCRTYTAANVATEVTANPTGDGEITVSWHPVPRPVGLTNYLVETVVGEGGAAVDAITDGFDTSKLVDPDVTAVTFDGLPAGAYAFVVTPVFGDEHGVTSSASQLVTTAGVILGGTITGRVLDATNQPFAGAEVRAYLDEDLWVGRGLAVTGPDGTYAMDLAPGEYRILFRSAAGTGWVQEWWQHSATRAGAPHVLVQADAVVADVDGKLAPGGSVTGTVTHTSGDPVEGAVVWIYSDTDLWVGTAATTTREDGTYDLGGIPEGSYRVMFRAPHGSGLAHQWWNGLPIAQRWSAPQLFVTWNQAVPDVDARLAAP